MYSPLPLSLSGSQFDISGNCVFVGVVGCAHGEIGVSCPSRAWDEGGLRPRPEQRSRLSG